ncbi:hypothetical protein [Halostagnicola sp. A-GB9-2]|uniref:hypothetical protein n=1 Tax=Halostagnicola sp. A-GB9-2 TaxID=3048066 RepID=UPI0024BFDE38|nr:hypothetical protein [Halostagnicola sp. A-GB9-2]MDJ1434844.1 hypothetical protein [Halostagnicola sp. A-GB9-2]
MPSRRKFLSSSGAALVGTGIAGCLSGKNTRSAEWLQLKAISVKWSRDGRSYSDQILQLMSDGEDEIRGTVASEYNDVISSPSEVTASGSFHNDLQFDFEAIKYVVGFCGSDFSSDDESGCLNTRTSREDFNAVQFGDQADVEVTDNQFHIHDVQSESISEWDTDISRFELSEKHDYLVTK